MNSLPEAIPALKALMAQPDVLVINLLRYEVGPPWPLFQRQSPVPPPSIQWSRPYHSMIDDSVRTLLETEPMAHRRLQ